MAGTTMIVEPTAVAPRSVREPAWALEGLEGRVVGFVDNVKPNFHYLVDDLAEILVSKHGVASVVKHRKRTASEPAPGEIIADIVKQCDLVITGSGD